MTETISARLPSIRAFAASEHRRIGGATGRHRARVDTRGFVPGCAVVRIVYTQSSRRGGRHRRRGVELTQTVSARLPGIRAFAASQHRRIGRTTGRHWARVDAHAFVPDCAVVRIVYIKSSHRGGRRSGRRLQLAQAGSRHLNERAFCFRLLVIMSLTSNACAVCSHRNIPDYRMPSCNIPTAESRGDVRWTVSKTSVHAQG